MSETSGLPPMSVAAAAAARDIAANRSYDAETRLRERLQTAPDDIHSLLLLGELASEVNQLADAAILFASALAHAPEFREARYRLAVVLHRQARSREALAEATVLRAAFPAEPLYRALEAALRAAVGDHVESLALYEGLFADGHHGPRLSLSYGHGLKTVGRAGEAAAMYRRLVESHDPEDQPLLGEAWWSLANLKTAPMNEADRKAIQIALRSVTTTDECRVHLHYAHGKALEDLGDPDAAFADYAAGAAIRRRHSSYDSALTTARVKRTIELLTSEFLASRTGQGALARDPIFIIGLPRAGSTLVEQILASHPQVEATMELVELPALAREAGIEGPGTDPAAIARLPAVDLRWLGDAYLDRTRIYRKTDRPYFIDKLPNNWLYIAMIRLILPNATIIDVRRSPVASCVSAFKQLFARGQAFSYDLRDVGLYYRDYVELMDHVDLIAPGEVHRVIYEDLVDDIEAEVRRLLDHVGLPFEPACLTFQDTQRAIWTPSAEQVRQPLYREALEQWRMFKGHLAPLNAALRPVMTNWRGTK